MDKSLRARVVWAIILLAFSIEGISRLLSPLGTTSLTEIASITSAALIIGAMVYLFYSVSRPWGVMVLLIIGGTAVLLANLLRLMQPRLRETGWFILDQNLPSHSVMLSVLDWIAICSMIAAFTWLVLMLHESRVLVAKQTVDLSREVNERRNAEQRLRRVIDHIPNFIFARDVKGRFLFGNTALAEAYGCSVDELEGRAFRVLHPDHAEAEVMMAHDRLVLERHGEAVTVEEAFTDRHGRRRLMQTTKVPYVSGEGKLPAVLGISTDISALKKEEEARRAWDVQVQHTQKLESLGMMAGGVAHDFNNLLGAIIGNVELARLSLPEANTAQRPLNEVQRAAERAADLANNLLAYTGKGDVHKEHADLNALVLDMMPFVRATSARQTRFERDLAGDLPAVEIDPTQIRQVILNLLTNAAESLGEEGGTVTVSTGVRQCSAGTLSQMMFHDGAAPGDYLYVRVRDTGVGMDAATQERVLDPFFTTKFTGRGLGMAAVMGIVRSHGGALEIESALGKGSTVAAYLPVALEAAPAPAPDRVEVSSDVDSLADGSGNILVIDDEEAIRSVAKRGLERIGFSVMTAGNGREGITLFRENVDDLVCVLVDLTMPEVGGADVCKMIRSIRKDLPVVLMTGYHESSVREIIADYRLDGFIKKPFSLVYLQSTIQQAIRSRSAGAAQVPQDR